jgi:hypothetical protein
MTQPYQQSDQNQGQNPFGAPAPGAPGRSGNLGVAIAVGFVAMIVGALIYGGLMRAMAKDNGEYSEIGYAAVVVGALVGAALGKIGGRNPALPIIAVLLSLVGIFLGQFFGYGLLINHWSEMPLADIYTEHSNDLFKGWKEDFDVMTGLFYLIGGAAAFSLSKKLGD